MAEQVARKSSRGITGEHHQRKAPLMMMDPGLGCRAQVVLWCSVVLFLFVVVCRGPEESTGFFVLRTEDAEAQDMRCRAQVVWWRTDGQVRTSVDSRMVTSRADPLAEACWHESKMTSALDVPCKFKIRGCVRFQNLYDFRTCKHCSPTLFRVEYLTVVSQLFSILQLNKRFLSAHALLAFQHGQKTELCLIVNRSFSLYFSCHNSSPEGAPKNCQWRIDFVCFNKIKQTQTHSNQVETLFKIAKS